VMTATVSGVATVDPMNTAPKKADLRKVILEEVASAPLQSRMFFLRQELGALKDNGNWRDDLFFPCIYFSCYDAMIEELATMDADDSGDKFFSPDDMHSISMNFLEAVNFMVEEAEQEEQAVTSQALEDDVPLLLVLGTNQVLLNPDEDDLRQIWEKRLKFAHQCKVFQEFDAMQYKTDKILTYASKHKKRKLLVTALKPRKKIFVSPAPPHTSTIAANGATSTTAVSTAAKKPNATETVAGSGRQISEVAAKVVAATDMEEGVCAVVAEPRKEAAVTEMAIATVAKEKEPEETTVAAKEPDLMDVETTDANYSVAPVEKSATANESAETRQRAGALPAESKNDCGIDHKDAMQASPIKCQKLSDHTNNHIPPEEIREHRGGCTLQHFVTLSPLAPSNSPARKHQSLEAPEDASEWEVEDRVGTVVSIEDVQLGEALVTRRTRYNPKNAQGTEQAVVSEAEKGALEEQERLGLPRASAVSNETMKAKLEEAASQNVQTVQTVLETDKGPHTMKIATESVTDESTKHESRRQGAPGTEADGDIVRPGKVNLDAPTVTTVTEEIEAPLLSTCSELPVPDSHEMDDATRLCAMEMAASLVEKSTADSSLEKHERKTGRPPKAPVSRRGRSTTRKDTTTSTKIGKNVGRGSSSRSSSPILRSLDETQREVPTFGQVKPSLLKLGCSIIGERSHNPMFCSWSYDTSPNAHNVEGKDFATCEKDFRRLLCSRGVGQKAISVWTPEERDRVEMWVRLAIVTCLPRRSLLPQSIPATPPGKTLKKLGFDWWYTYKLKASRWEYNAYVQDEPSLLSVLSHEGLPEDFCNFDEVDVAEQRQLELYLAFYKRDLYDLPYVSMCIAPIAMCFSTYCAPLTRGL
jgi:hypothetical protein